MFTAPTAFRAIKKEDPRGEHIARHDLRNFRTLFLAGERCDPDTLLWARDRLQVPVIDHWWQTETAWAIAANCVGLGMLPVKPGSPTKAAPGYDVRVLSEENTEMPAGQIGSIAIKLPMPPACLPTLWNNDAGYEKSYLTKHPGFYLTGDAGYRDEDGYLYIMSRVDDIINVAGHRLSTGAMEEVLSAHPDVAECAVVGVADEIKGEVPVGFVVTKAGVARADGEIVKELVEKIRQQIGPVASFRTALVVKRLPKTRSGKILRGTMKRIAESQEYTAPATIDDPAVLDEIADVAQGRRLRERPGMTTDPKAGPSVVRARVPLVDKAAATPAPLAVWDRIAQSRGRAAGPFAVLARKAGVRDEVISATERLRRGADAGGAAAACLSARPAEPG